MKSKQKTTNQASQENQSQKKTFPEESKGRVTLAQDVFRKIKEEVTQGIPQEIVHQLSARPSPQELHPGQEAAPRPPAPHSAEIRAQYYQRLTEELKVSEQREREETQQKVNILKESIRRLAKESKVLRDKAEKVALENSPEPGPYHINFLEKLIQYLEKIRKSIEEANLWLTAFQQRRKKRSYFWRQFKKSGTKFLLSSDRTPATQAE